MLQSIASMPSWDIRCTDCGALTHVTTTTARDRDQWLAAHPCPCGAQREPVPAAPAFAIKGYNEANGYGVR